MIAAPSGRRLELGVGYQAVPSGRRSSLGVPLASLIFPRSVADRYESHKLQRHMEEKYGFHYFTNAFCLAPATELEYTAFYTATAINPACYASMISWLLWLVVSMQSAFSLFAPDPEERFVGKLDLVISALVIVPVPLLVACCRAQRFRGYEQAFLCAIVTCFASVLLLGGAVSSVRDYRRFLMKDLDSLLNQITAESPASMSLNSSRIIHLDSGTAWWNFENFQGTGRALLVQYLETVILPIAHLNMSLLRPLIVLVIAPMFKLDPFHYIVAAFYVNIGYTLLVSLMYPPTRSVFYILNKFFLVFCLGGVTVVTVFRVRQTDRFLRLNFLHAKMVEDHARASQMQREMIINENKSLKKILEERNHSATGGPLDFDSPMTKVLTDLKSLQRSASLSPELRENLDGIVTLLSKKGHNLFAPDIHEQLKQKKEGDLDGDTKSWAATVLANKSYTRNRRASASYISQNKGGVQGAPQLSSSVPQRFVEARLHPDVLLPTEDSLNAVATMMDRDGWSVDTFVYVFSRWVCSVYRTVSDSVLWCGRVAEMSNNKPITYITYIVFEQHNLFELCTLNKNLLANFLSFLDIGYHRNPYVRPHSGALMLETYLT
jgi:cAMP-specific phosphodiesterase 4